MEEPAPGAALERFTPYSGMQIRASRLRARWDGPRLFTGLALAESDFLHCAQMKKVVILQSRGKVISGVMNKGSGDGKKRDVARR